MTSSHAFAAALGFVLAGALAIESEVCARAQTSEPSAAPLTDPAAEARRQYNLAAQAYAAHKFAEAAASFEAAASYKAHAVTLLTAGLAWEQAGQPERAADAFGRALEVPGLNAEQSTQAKDKLAAHEKKLGVVAVTAPEGWRVRLDGFTEVGVPARLHGAPGVHSLVVSAPGKEPMKREVKLEDGKRVELRFPEPEAAPVPPVELEKPKTATIPAAAPVPEAPASGGGGGGGLRKSIGLVAIGVGAAGVGAGVVLGLQALDAKDAYGAAPARATFDHASALQTWTNVAFVAGGAILVGGVVLFVWPSSSAEKSGEGSVKAAVTPGGLSLRGRF
jgi:PEGA domain